MKRFLKTILLLSVMVAAFCCRPEICRGQQDAEKAQPAASLEEIRKEAEGGDARAQWLLGSRYQFGEGVEKDEVQAVKWFRMAAEQGDVNAQHTLGAMYAVGQGVKKDLAEAAKWFSKAAEQGDAEAQNDLGVMYVKGIEVPKDYVEAYRWANVAAARGNSTAKEFRDLLERAMTREQIAEGQRRAAAFVARPE